MSGSPLRGSVWFVEHRAYGQKPYVIISNNRRNRALLSVIAARITTAPKPSMPTVVELPHGEAVGGRVLCDTLNEIDKTRLVRHAGALSAPTMRAIDDGLRAALAL